MNFIFEEVLALKGHAKNLVIMLHGIASESKELISLVPYMSQSLDQTHFISLNAPYRYDMGIFGYQWFSAQKWELKPIQDGLAKVVPEVVKFLENKIKEIGLRFEDVFLFGFSQGSMVATHIITSISKKLAGVIGIGGPITPRSMFEGNNQIPVCLIHGENDSLINVEEMYKGEKYLRGLGFNVEAHAIPFLGHSIDVKCIKIAINFIKNHHAG